jgi:pilus assembly protein CpaB
MKNKKPVIALAAAAVAAAIFYVSLKAKENSVLAGGNRNTVITARGFIPAGATITSGLVSETEIQENCIQPGALRKRENAEGRIALACFAEGEQILANKVTGTADRLSSVVPIGYRAVAVAVDKVSGLNGMIKPGDSADVIGYFEDAGQRGSFSATVLQGARVLAVDDVFIKKEAQRQEGQDLGSLGQSAVTLALEPSDAEILLFAEQKGRLVLSLRNPGDDKFTATKTTNFGNLLRSGQKEPARAPQDVQSLEIIRGTEGEKVQIKK